MFPGVLRGTTINFTEDAASASTLSNKDEIGYPGRGAFLFLFLFDPFQNAIHPSLVEANHHFIKGGDDRNASSP
jgi:hypothetical protein